MKCPNCQYENPEDAKFCEQCGAQLLYKCPGCGAEVNPTARFCKECGHSLVEPTTTLPTPPSHEPSSFVNGRYEVKKFLGEGGKKKVYLVHDTLLDRDVAFALIKTEKLDDASRTRVTREARAMGRLGDHPNIVAIYDMGDHEGQPYIVIPVMPGGDVEGLIEKAPSSRQPVLPKPSAGAWSLPTPKALSTATSSRAMSGSVPMALPRSATSAWLWQLTSHG